LEANEKVKSLQSRLEDAEKHIQEVDVVELASQLRQLPVDEEQINSKDSSSAANGQDDRVIELQKMLNAEINHKERLSGENDRLISRLQETETAKRKIENDLEEVSRSLRKMEKDVKLLQSELASSARLDSMLSGEPGPWVQHANDFDMPVPTHLSLESPVIQTILQAWTQDPKNLQFFNKWCAHILRGGDIGPHANFQKGVELSKCSPNVKDGLLSILVPLLRARRDIEISVFTRDRIQVYHDVRLRVTKTENEQQTT
jgi:hypothetical protein